MPDMTPMELSLLVKSLAREVGFDLVGVARAEGSAHGEEYREWIAAGKHGAMHYLAKGVEERVDLRKKFPWAKSVVCVALGYWQEEKPEAENQQPEERQGKIARYAWGRDYHKVMEGKLGKLEAKLRTRVGNLQARTYSDTGPLLERELAMRAGLGWIGKNTLLVHPRHGSWFVLGEMVVDLEMNPDSPMEDHCGTCRRCIEACPTAAIEPYTLDGRRCISYLTLENRGQVAQEFLPAMREAAFVAGCDICQEVCPFNRSPLPVTEPDLLARSPAPRVGAKEIQAWSEAEWDRITRGRAFRRAKFEMWKRNARIVASSEANTF